MTMDCTNETLTLTPSRRRSIKTLELQDLNYDFDLLAPELIMTPLNQKIRTQTSPPSLCRKRKKQIRRREMIMKTSPHFFIPTYDDVHVTSEKTSRKNVKIHLMPRLQVHRRRRNNFPTPCLEDEQKGIHRIRLFSSSMSSALDSPAPSSSSVHSSSNCKMTRKPRHLASRSLSYLEPRRPSQKIKRCLSASALSA